MIDVKTIVYSRGDAYLQCDTQEWVNDRGEHSEAWTNSLREYMETHEYQYPSDGVVIEWAQSVHEHMTSEGKASERDEVTGLYGDPDIWSHMLPNQGDHMLDQEIGFVILTVPGIGEIMVWTTVGSYGSYTAPDVYLSTVDDTAEWADYTRAYGACKNGHHWDTDDTLRLHSDGTWSRPLPRIDEQSRLPFGDPSCGYIKCPTPGCRKALKFWC